jgi:hypothetical protein
LVNKLIGEHKPTGSYNAETKKVLACDFFALENLWYRILFSPKMMDMHAIISRILVLVGKMGDIVFLGVHLRSVLQY